MRSVLARAGTQHDQPAQALLGLGLLAVVALSRRRWHRDREMASALRRDKIRPAALRVPDHPPQVSVLVAAWQEQEHVEPLIRSFLSLDYPNKELVICAGGDDGTYDRARCYTGSQVIVLQQGAGEGKQRALQRCLSMASGDIIFLTDADCILDDDSFARTLAPILAGEEAVATGVSRPNLAEAIRNPFVAHQWSAQAYAMAHLPTYVSGLLGRNCALSRQALESAGEFAPPAPTGTDYHLAKHLQAGGYRIRHVPESMIETRYPTDIAGYVRQQARWLRNVILYGPRFGARTESLAGLWTALTGLAMLGVPFAALFVERGGLLAGWIVALAWAITARIRYLRFAEILMGRRLPRRTYLLAWFYLLIDFLAWAWPLTELWSEKGRQRW